MNVSHKRYADRKLTNMTIIVGGPEEIYHEEKFDQLLGLDYVSIERDDTNIMIRNKLT